ncbi:MAG: rhodanese-like domain-containing protein, partial [Gammaproteobacteria bacterium]
MIRTLTIFVLIGLVTNLAADGSDLEVKISPTIESISVMHNNERLTITREQNLTNLVNEIYAKTSRPCPPFCIQ